MSFVAGHAFGNGVACWVIISEIYPTQRFAAAACPSLRTALWLVGYLGNQLFPIIAEAIWDADALSGFSARAHC